MTRKDSSEYGWLVIRRAEYDRMRVHEYAGPGTPCNPDAPGYWAMVNEGGATVLYTGVTIEDSVVSPTEYAFRVVLHYQQLTNADSFEAAIVGLAADLPRLAEEYAVEL